jgi:guanylate kinase
MVPVGTLYIIAAASGTGKTSLAKALSESLSDINISISHTTRAKRAGEEANKHYFFIDKSEFEAMIIAQKFLEYAEVFGQYYGTSYEWVNERLAKGCDVVLDIDWQGAVQIRQKMPCISIFLLPPSMQELCSRLEARKREGSALIAQRLAQASHEISHYKEFDYVIINDNFAHALQDLQTIVKTQRLRTFYQAEKYAALLQELL